VREKSLKTPRSVKKGGRRCSGHQSQDCTSVHEEDHGEADCSLAVHGGPQWSRYRIIES